jgi:hypothetical protein
LLFRIARARDCLAKSAHARAAGARIDADRFNDAARIGNAESRARAGFGPSVEPQRIAPGDESG